MGLPSKQIPGFPVRLSGGGYDWVSEQSGLQLLRAYAEHRSEAAFTHP